MAGVVPGLMLATMLGVTTWYRAWRNDYPRMKRASWGECLTAFRESFWGLFLIILVLGGIYAGLFTPTEAAADGGGLCIPDRGFRLQGAQAAATCRASAQSRRR